MDVEETLNLLLKPAEKNVTVLGDVGIEKYEVTVGYDAQNSVYTDMFQSGIIDPTKPCLRFRYDPTRRIPGNVPVKLRQACSS